MEVKIMDKFVVTIDTGYYRGDLPVVTIDRTSYIYERHLSILLGFKRHSQKNLVSLFCKTGLDRDHAITLLTEKEGVSIIYSIKAAKKMAEKVNKDEAKAFEKLNIMTVYPKLYDELERIGA